MSSLSVPGEPPFALRDKEKSAATSRGGRMLCRNLSLGFLLLTVDTQMITALPSVLVIASHSAGISPEGVQPPLPLYGHAAPPLMQSWVLVIAMVAKITAQPPLIGKNDSSRNMLLNFIFQGGSRKDSHYFCCFAGCRLLPTCINSKSASRLCHKGDNY